MKFRCIALWTAVVLLLAGCASVHSEPTEELQIPPTVEDIFQISTEATEETPVNTEPVGQNPGETTAPQPTLPMEMGGASMEPLAQFQYDDHGVFLPYEGGELTLDVRIAAHGYVGQNGVGVLIFVDGQPQPYKTEEEPEYAYMHTFPATGNLGARHSFTFAPVTGKTGDDVEFHMVYIFGPSRTAKEAMAGIQPTFGSPLVNFRLKFMADAPKAEFPEKEALLHNVTVTYEDTTYDDVGSWSDRDLLEKHALRMSVDGVPNGSSCIVSGVTAGRDIPVRFEVWGSPYVHYGIVFFVDHKPVCTADIGDFFLDVKSGQRTVMDATLQLHDLEEGSVFYALLIPRNARICEVPNTCGYESSSTFFLLGE